MESEVNKGFNLEDGPFVKGLDASLKSFKVERQAYYGGTFIGNHVHKCLKVCVAFCFTINDSTFHYIFQDSNSQTLCNSILDTAIRLCPSLTSEAGSVCDKFKLGFSLFGCCHRLYNGNKLSDEDINELGIIIFKNATCISTFFLVIFRNLHPHLHGLFPKNIPWRKCNSQDALTGGTHVALAKEVAPWIWHDGRAGG